MDMIVIDLVTVGLPVEFRYDRDLKVVGPSRAALFSRAHPSFASVPPSIYSTRKLLLILLTFHSAGNSRLHAALLDRLKHN